MTTTKKKRMCRHKQVSVLLLFSSPTKMKMKLFNGTFDIRIIQKFRFMEKTSSICADTRFSKRKLLHECC